MSSRFVYADAFKAAPLPMLLLAADAPAYTLLDANDACCNALQLQKNELTGKGISELLPAFTAAGKNAGDPDHPGNMLKRVVAEQKAHTAYGQQLGILSPDGQNAEAHLWNITSTPVGEENGAVTAILLSLENIDARVALLQAQSETRNKLAGAQHAAAIAEESAGLLEAIINTVQAGVFLFTPVRADGGAITDFRFRICNRMLAAYVGEESAALFGEPGSKWFPGYKTNGLFDRYKATAETGVTDRFEFHYNADGIDVWLDILSTKVGEDVLVTFTDFTSLKNLQRRLEDHVAQLRASNANLEQFAYIASHDLQEPLRKIKSFGDMLQVRYGQAIDASGADLIKRMQQAAERMSILIRDLLTYSRVSVKPANPELVDTAKVLEDVLFDLEQTVRQSSAVVRAEKLLPVMGQATQIGQLFSNILSNAIKFQNSGQRPEISISTEVVRGGDSGIAVSREDSAKSFQRIRISDNGIGFEPEYKEKIFHIFQRLHGRSAYPGTGVGLSIVQKVVENHHGYIAADSAPGEGATFTILLPLVS